MKLPFRIIVISIIVALTAIFGWQLYWLTGLYSSIKQETYTTIVAAIEKADVHELLCRGKAVEAIDKKKGTNNQNRLVSRSYNYGFEIFSAMPTIIMESIYSGLHESLDFVLPINFQYMRRYILSECRSKGINLEIYRIFFDVSSGPKENQHQFVKVLPRNMECVTYTNKEGKYTYKVYITPLMHIVLYRMSGILISTLLIILLLGVAFWYLIHVIMKQRTLEEMKDDFTNNMTHELKTPVAVAYSAADTLLNFKQGDDKAKREKYLQICLDQLSRLSNLIEQILSMSMERRKSLTMKKELLDVAELVDQLMEYHRLKSDKEVAFHVRIDPPHLHIFADATHMSNVMSNLIDNAIKYSADKAEITIEAAETDSMSRIVVSDQGIGIDRDNQSRIFEKFYRVPTGNMQHVRGYGLGLYYVKQIMEKHGGSISVESELGKGSTFTLLLPKRK